MSLTVPFNYRITAAVEKVELLWQQLFSKARLRLRVFQLRDNALQVGLTASPHVMVSFKKKKKKKFKPSGLNQNLNDLSHFTRAVLV